MSCRSLKATPLKAARLGMGSTASPDGRIGAFALSGTAPEDRCPRSDDAVGKFLARRN